MKDVMEKREEVIKVSRCIVRRFNRCDATKLMSPDCTVEKAHGVHSWIIPIARYKLVETQLVVLVRVISFKNIIDVLPPRTSDINYFQKKGRM